MDYSDRFIKIFAEETKDGLKSKEKYRLPKRWDGRDFCRTIYAFFEEYKKDVITGFPDMEQEIKSITRNLYYSLVKSYQGLSQESYGYFEKAMTFLEKDPLLFDIENQADLKLYRVVDAGSTELPDRSRVFHVPFSMRSKMATQRFSIPGFPSLYLGSSIELCCEEIEKNILCPTAIVAKFEFCPHQNEIAYTERQFKIFDISINPNRIFDGRISYEINEKTYLRWYPLVAACSFIRAKKADPYAPEYIFSQHFMQWVRIYDSFMLPGIKYFSCSTEHASEMGDNYAFPTTGVPYRIRNTLQEYDYLLTQRFKLTNPCFLNEFQTYMECEEKLSHDETKNIKFEPDASFSDVYQIPNGEIEIGYAAFVDCEHLTKINIPDSVVSIGLNAFWGCSNLTSIVIPNSVTSISGGAFAYCMSLTKITIPDSVTSIGNGAFMSCEKLTEIVVPDSITRIGDGTYFRCKSLAKIIIPDSVTSIGKVAFFGCQNLNEITIPYSIKSIGNNAFEGCTNCKITIDAGNPSYYCRDNCIYERGTDRMVSSTNADPYS